MVETVLRENAGSIPIQYEIYDGNDLMDVSGYDAVRLYIQGYASNYITASVISTGVVNVIYPSSFMTKGNYKAKFQALTGSDLIPLGQIITIIVKGTWEE